MAGKTTETVSQFQSTPPARGATVFSPPLDFFQTFQSTPPARGATLTCPSGTSEREVFQSTPPARGATIFLHLVAVHITVISIHAPREGGDG